jgi:hypothetical protein
MSAPAKPSRMLKKSASVVLASLEASTYPPAYASTSRSLRPCWTAFLNILRVVCEPPVLTRAHGFQWYPTNSFSIAC